MLWAGLVLCVVALSRFAVRGFAPDGRFPVGPAVGLGLGIALVTLSGWWPGGRRTAAAAAKGALEEAA